ncbi:fumarylacetoacetate hydrolase family protein [Lacihabitans sp. CS3-21]|uniref:fumarylacetoacetate hydrolase family protein n=1 Tax=Lacihabitans sp. CS3-21 TaxID=2487332 RepID=UPI0020CC3542|nr:fumarylacetoacetate hydrolase family protein [Lacihabitans sp. CS3-21]MCP9747826.1 FAA hydrolase family protein [Lacihabitans sp. CS3-21]
MKLIRFGAFENEKPGVLSSDGKKLNVSAFGEDYNEKFFATNGLERLSEWLKTNECPEVSETERLGSCVARPSKIICIGLNYAKHAAESGMDVPKEPVVFFKSTTALCGPNDNVIIPRNSVKTDWEVELAVIIGKKASYITEETAMDYVAGYALHNDYSEREFQLERGGQWVKGKSNDTFAPLGPFMATKDEVADPHNLNLWLELNGKKIQDSNTNDLIFNIPQIVSYLSNFMTLLPGDVISTGTPAGVGLGFKPPMYLKAGDVVELGIEGLGEQKQTALAWG